MRPINSDAKTFPNVVKDCNYLLAYLRRTTSLPCRFVPPVYAHSRVMWRRLLLKGIRIIASAWSCATIIWATSWVTLFLSPTTFTAIFHTYHRHLFLKDCVSASPNFRNPSIPRYMLYNWPQSLIYHTTTRTISVYVLKNIHHITTQRIVLYSYGPQAPPLWKQGPDTTAQSFRQTHGLLIFFRYL